MRLSHADFRPGKRPRFVPSGSPRRKFPLIRIAVLLALGVFIYTRFDGIWSDVRTVANPVTAWNKIVGRPEAPDPERLPLAWSRDSSRVSLECPRGLDGDCCESLGRADRSLCGETAALLEKAGWRGIVKRGPDEGRPLRLEARAVVSDLGDWGFELAELRGRDASGPYALRRGAGSGSWCDARRGCLGSTVARAPLTDGRMIAIAGTDSLQGGATRVRWLSPSSRVRAVLPGRIVSVGPASSGTDGGAPVTVRVYHGGELYASYGPLKALADVKPGILVKSGSYLGDALPSGSAPDAGGSGYALNMSLRQGGRPADAAALWGRESAPPPPAASSEASASRAPDEGVLYSGIR